HDPTAPSLSHTSALGTPPSWHSTSHCPPMRSADSFEQIIRPVSHREYPDTITSTAGLPTCPNPKGISAGGNHRSHCASSPGPYDVLDAGSTGRYTGRRSRTRSRSTVIDCVHPIRSAITVAG